MIPRPPQITTRPLVVADFAMVERWLEGTVLKPPSGGIEGWRRMLEGRRILCRIGVAEPGAAVGFLRLDLAPDQTAEITLVVARAERRKGFGAALLEAALREARTRGLRRLVAVVADRCPAAREFFLAAGFERVCSEPTGFDRLERIVHTGERVAPLEITP